MSEILRNVRYGLRVLARSRIFTAVAVVSLALGIGANAAIFHLLDTLTLRSLAVARPHELVEVRPDGPQAFGNYDGANARATYPLWEQIRASQQALQVSFAWGTGAVVAGRGAEGRLRRALWVSGEFFSALDVRPHRGRLLEPADDRRGCGPDAVVVSHAFWQRELGGSEAAIGSALTLRDLPFTIVGVTPPSFSGLEIGETFDVSLPLCAAALWDARIDRKDRWWLTIMGRLRPDWTIAQASEHLRGLSPGLLEATVPPGYDAAFVKGYQSLRFSAVSSARGVSRLRDAHGTSLWMLMGLTVLVLLITCSNLATLVLARASAREREIAVRAAIGASRWRLVSQMLVESVLLTVAGASLAVPVAVICSRVLVAFLESSAGSIYLNLAADWRLASFVAGAAGLAVLVFGLLPALRVSAADPIAAMRRASRGVTRDPRRVRLQRTLVVGQLAISLVLVFSALLFVQTLRNLAAVDPGFQQEGTLTVQFQDRSSEGLAAERITAFQEELTRTIRSLPGVSAAASSTHIPLDGSTWAHFFRVPGARQASRRASRFAYVGPEYFAALRIPIRSGRSFQDLDTARSRPVMVVNESFVRRHLDGQDPIGATIHRFAEPGFPETTYEIVGVVGDTKYAELRDEDCWCDTPGGSMAPIAYVPIAQNASPYAWAHVIVRSDLPGEVMKGSIARRVAQLSPSIVTDVTELRRRVERRLTGERIVAWLSGAFGILATALVMVGLYGLIAYLTASRRHEIGIRLSLGSTRAGIVRLVLRDSVQLLAFGLAVGLPLAVLVMRSAGTLLFGLPSMHLPTAAGAAIVLAAASLLAAAVPAWRASRVSPDIALRAD